MREGGWGKAWQKKIYFDNFIINNHDIIQLQESTLVLYILQEVDYGRVYAGHSVHSLSIGRSQCVPVARDGRI